MRLILLLCVLTITQVFGQKKYDYISFLLLSRQYNLGEPYLRDYLKDTKNNPSANFFMGRIFEDKMNSLTDPAEILVLADSAILFYTIARFGVTEKEVKKHQFYYTVFAKRDLKTGKYKVDFSDVIFDIQSRIDNLVTIKKALLLTNDQRIGSVLVDENVAPEPLMKSGGKYFAIIIGVSSYDSTYLNLDRPNQDAIELKNLLVTSYRFDETNVFTLQSPTRNQILMTLFSFRKKISPIDNLLIFYAGHGYWDKDINQGYWWPRDASPENPTNWLSNSDIREQIRGIKSFHTLLISDACFSGGILKVRGGNTIRDAPLDIISLYSLPSRRAITSGTLTQVPDKSVFFDYLIKRLRNNTETYLTSQSLFDSFKQAVINNSLIVPQDGVISDTGDEGGDFVFIKRNN